MRTCWINGQFVPESEAKLSIFDRGVLFGDGVYEVAAVFQGRLLDADLHLARLTRSLGEIGMPAPLANERWLEVMQELATTNGIDEGLSSYLQKRVARRAAFRSAAVKLLLRAKLCRHAGGIAARRAICGGCGVTSSRRPCWRRCWPSRPRARRARTRP